MLLLPSGAPLPRKPETFPKGFTFTRVGLVIAGAAIGTTEFIQDHARKHCEATSRTRNAIVKMGLTQPSDALGLLPHLHNSHSYFFSVHPTALLHEAIATLDQLTTSAIFSILYNPSDGTSPTSATNATGAQRY